MTKEEVMSVSEGAYYSTFFSWKKLWNVLEQIIKRFKTIIVYMGFASPSQDHAQPQTTQSTEGEEVVEEEEHVGMTTSTSRTIAGVGGNVMMFRVPPRRKGSRGDGPKTDRSVSV